MHGNMHISLPPTTLYISYLFITNIISIWYIFRIFLLTLMLFMKLDQIFIYDWARSQVWANERTRYNMQHLSLAMTSSSVIDRKLILKQCLHIFSKTLRNKSWLNFNEQQKDLGHENTIQRWSFENCTILSFTWTNVIFIYLILEITFHVYMVWIIKITPISSFVWKYS